MNYIFDVLLNFNDDEDILEFFEWEETDCTEHIKKIPIFKVDPNKMQEICNNKIKVTEDFLLKIKNQTYMYGLKKILEYACLVTDKNKVVGLEFSNNGTIISRSCLLLDEEEDIIEECEDMPEETINIEIISPYDKGNFLTREERKRQNYLIAELNNIKKDSNIEKFNYLYLELFTKDNLPFEKKYHRFISNIKNNYNEKHNKLYELLKLTYSEPEK